MIFLFFKEIWVANPSGMTHLKNKDKILLKRKLELKKKTDSANDTNNDRGEGSTADGVLSDEGYSKENLAERRKLMQDRKSNLTTEIIFLIPEYISFDFVSRYLIILLLYVKETNFISR